MTNKITTKCGQAVMVSAEDLHRVAHLKWYLSKDYKTGYITVRATVGKSYVKLHRFIMDEKNPSVIIDHIDGNVFNCQRDNLRRANHATNMMNRKVTKGKRFKGTRQRGNKFIAIININKKRTYLGSFNTEEEAAQAYNSAAQNFFGEFAKMNTHIGATK